MKARWLWVLSAVAVILPPGLKPAHAQERAAVEDEVALAIPPLVAERAGISPEQQAAISHLMAEANRELAELRKRHRSAQQALDRLLRKKAPPDQVVMTQIERVGAAETEIRKNRVALMLRIRGLLGPDAWANLQLELEVQRRLAERQRDLPPPPARDVPRVGEPIRVEPVSGTLRSGPR